MNNNKELQYIKKVERRLKEVKCMPKYFSKNTKEIIKLFKDNIKEFKEKYLGEDDWFFELTDEGCFTVENRMYYWEIYNKKLSLISNTLYLIGNDGKPITYTKEMLQEKEIENLNSFEWDNDGVIPFELEKVNDIEYVAKKIINDLNKFNKNNKEEK